MKLLTTCVVLMTIGVASCDPGPKKVTIGAMYPTGGSQGTQGTEELRGVQLAEQWANDHGGVRGRKIRLVEASADRAEAVPAAMKDLRAKGADIVVGSHASAVSAEAARVAT